MKDLITKLEAATEGGRELDLEITKALGFCDPSAWYDEEADCLGWNEIHPFGSTTAAEQLFDQMHHYTISLDAALTLVPEGCSWHVSTTSRDVFDAWCMPWRDVDNPKLDKPWVSALNPALALCIAALKARAA